jgi:hypothetical protein
MHWCGGSVPDRRQLITRTKIQEEARFRILRLLHENPELNQRELGERESGCGQLLFIKR